MPAQTSPPHHRSPSRAAALLACFATAACSGGKHTGELAEAAAANMRHVRAAADYDLAYQQFEVGNMQLALQAIDNAIEGAPEASRSHLLKGRILMEKGPAKPALASLDRALELSPDDPEILYTRGIALERMDQLPDALDNFMKAHELDESHAEYLIAGLELLTDLGRLDDAAEIIGQQPFELRNHPGVKQILGHIGLMRGDPAAAVDAFTQAVLLNPDDPVLREDLSRADVAMGRFADAESNLAHIAGTDHYRRRRDLRHMHAACLIELDRPVEARALLLDLTQGDTGQADFDAWFRLADVALILRDDSLLRQSANRMINMAPQRYEGYVTLAMWQRRSGDLSGALDSVMKAEERSDGDATASRLRRLVEHDLAVRG